MNPLRVMLACAALTALAACGGGSATVGGGIGGTGKPGVKFGGVGVGGAGVSVGGTLFDTTAAIVQIGGTSATVDDLRAGHVALVAGLIDGATGVADHISVEEVVKGVLQSRPGVNVLKVQGQVIEIDERTVYGPGIAPSSADGLVAGDLLEIWGFVKGEGLVRATRIERESSLSEIRIVGIARNVDKGGDTFDIGTQPIDHGAADVSKLPTGDPEEDELVRVRGGAVLGGQGEVVATRVEPYELENQDDDDEAGLEGFVTAVFPGTGLRLGATKILTHPATVYVHGEASDLAVGAEVEVEGPVEGGAVRARRVLFRASVRLEGDVAVMAGDLLGLETLSGVVIRVDGLTLYKGLAATFGDVQVGDHVEVRARRGGPTTVVAVEVRETAANTDLLIQGPVDGVPAPSNPLFSILGVTIDTSGIAAGQFESPTGAPLDRAGFFALLRAGLTVQVSGEKAGGVAIWDEAELDDD
ncbi:MAG: DUF5666 domain-containing protein [Planctomycetota bacterium]|nr:DUF5666 domain-containing protein [Planctomycetota bacterium]